MPLSSAINSSTLKGDSLEGSFSFLPRERGFKLASLNITSLPKHIDELRILLADRPIDILSINETRLDDSVVDHEVHILGYDIIRRDRNGNGGGVCFYVRSTINYSLRPDLSVNQLENLCIEVRKPHSKPFVVATWYRPPDSPTEIFTHFESLVGRLDSQNVDFYLLGDLNCNLASSTFDTNTNLLTSIADIYSLHQLIREPTRITSSSSTLLDLIFTNCPDKVACSGVSHVGISDHSLVYAYRKLCIDRSGSGHKTVTYRKFKNFSSESFRNDIASQRWDDLLNFEDPNDMWLAWKTLFLNVVDKHAPLRTKRVRPSKCPWITPQLKKCMCERDKLKRKATITNDPWDWANFKKFRNQVNNKIKNAKEIYYKNAFQYSRGSSRKTWQTINELTSRNSSNLTVREVRLDDNSISIPEQVSEAFNKHFASIGPKLASEIHADTNGFSYREFLSGTDKRFELQPTDNNKVRFLLSKLCISKATGLDMISARLLRECTDLISHSLCEIFNLSIVTGVFPEEWKCSKVIPLFKQGERADMNNYRPISVIPVVAKVFERIIYDQLYAYLSENNMIAAHQSGFRSLHSTVTALLEASNNWAYNIDKGNVNAVVFLDLKKAFDTVDHDILLSKLSSYGIHGNSLNWFRSYLDNRQQKCFINGSLSDKLPLGRGVPRDNFGSIVVLDVY